MKNILGFEQYNEAKEECKCGKTPCECPCAVCKKDKCECKETDEKFNFSKLGKKKKSKKTEQEKEEKKEDKEIPTKNFTKEIKGKEKGLTAAQKKLPWNKGKK